jgi:hypothetical protein
MKKLLNHRDPRVHAEVHDHPERFTLMFRMQVPERTIHDSPLTEVTLMRDAFQTTYVKSAYVNKDTPEHVLDFYLLGVWLHSFFWGMSPEDRAFMLNAVYDIPSQSETIEKRIRKQELKSWSDFPDAYPAPPVKVMIYSR